MVHKVLYLALNQDSHPALRPNILLSEQKVTGLEISVIWLTTVWETPYYGKLWDLLTIFQAPKVFSNINDHRFFIWNTNGETIELSIPFEPIGPIFPCRPMLPFCPLSPISPIHNRKRKATRWQCSLIHSDSSMLAIPVFTMSKNTLYPQYSLNSRGPAHSLWRTSI